MIRIQAPQGILPRYNPRLLNNNQAQKAFNCVLDQGDCRPLKDTIEKQSLTSSTKTVFKYGSWRQFDNYASVIRSPVDAGDYRYYWTDENGGGYKTEEGKGALPLGVPQPDTGPSLTKGGSSSEDNPLRSSVYVYTRVTAWGEESAPSGPSGVMDVYDGEWIEFSDISDGESSHVTHYRIYRTIGGHTGSVYVAVPFQTTAGDIIYDGDNNIKYDIPKGDIGDMKDGLRDADLTVSMEVLDWLEPPSDMKFLTDLGNGIMMGASGKEVVFSALWAPYAYPLAYRYNLDSQVTGVGHVAGIPVAFTKYSTYIFDGSTPDSFQQRKISETQGCVSHLSICSTLDGVLFASREGLCVANPNGVNILSLPVWLREQWKEMDINNLIGAYFNKRYYGFFKGDKKGFIFSLNDIEQSIVEFELDDDVVNVYVEGDGGHLYIVFEGHLDEFDVGDNLTSQWKSKIFRVGPINFSSFKIVGDEGDSKITFYVDGQQKYQILEAEHNKSYRLPTGFIGREFEIEIKSEYRWYSMGMSRSMEELNNV